MTFEVGDRVRCITDADGNSATNGVAGTVRRVVDGFWITVEFDEDVNGHAEGSLDIEYGRAWDCQPGDLELLDDRERVTGSIGEFFKKQEALYASR